MGRKKKAELERTLEFAETAPANTIGSLVPVKIKVTDIPSIIDVQRISQSPFLPTMEKLLNHHFHETPRNAVTFESQMALRFVVLGFMNCRYGMNIALVDERGKKIRGARRKLIERQAGITSVLFSIVLEVFSTTRIAGYSSAFELWGQCVIEDFVMSEEFVNSSEYISATKEKGISVYEKCTQALREMRNPYTASAHKAVFDAAIAMSEKTAGRKINKFSFYAQHYLLYLSARSEFSNYVSQRKSKTKVIGK